MEKDFVEIKIDKTTLNVNKVVFRRMLNAARAHLGSLKSSEGKMFPKIDNMALEEINKIQSFDIELI